MLSALKHSAPHRIFPFGTLLKSRVCQYANNGQYYTSDADCHCVHLVLILQDLLNSLPCDRFRSIISRYSVKDVQPEEHWEISIVRWLTRTIGFFWSSYVALVQCLAPPSPQDHWDWLLQPLPPLSSPMILSAGEAAIG